MARPDAQFILSAIDQTKAAFASVKGSFGDLTSQVSKAQALLGGLGAGLSLAALAGQIRSVVDAADDLNKLSQSVGIGVESLSKLQYGAELAGVSSEQLGTALRQLSKAAADGKKVFDYIGLDPRKFRDTETLLRAIAQRFSEVEDGAAKTAAAQELFGESGTRLIPLLNQGAAGFDAFAREAEDLGLVISSKTAAAAEKFNDDLTRLGASARSVFRELAEDALPVLQQITNELLAGREAFGSFWRYALEQPLSDLWRSSSEQLARYRKELQDLQRDRQALGGLAEAAGIDEREAQLKRLISYYERLQKIQRDDALAITGGRRDLDPRDIRANPSTTKPKGQFGSKADEDAAKSARDAAKRRQDAAEAYLAALAKEFLGIRDLSREEEVLQEIQLGRMVKLTKAEQARALSIAREIDAVKRRKDAEKDLADFQKREEDAMQQSRRNSARIFEDLLEEQKAAAERQAQEIASIIGRTYSGQLAEIDKMEKTLKEALVRGSKGLENGINLEQFREAMQLLEQMREDAAAQQLPEEFDKIRNQGKDAFEDLKRSIEGWGRSTSRVFADVLNGGQSLADGLRSVFQSLASELLEQYLYKQIFEPLFAAVGGALGGSSFFSGLFGGAKAAGGPVSGGKMYLVGEKGPELFVPGRSGSIIPNGAMGGGGVNIVQNIHVDARADVASVNRAMAIAKEQAKAEILDSRRRGGVFA